jgi:hypothetical protein
VAIRSRVRSHLLGDSQGLVLIAWVRGAEVHNRDGIKLPLEIAAPNRVLRHPSQVFVEADWT